MESTIGAGISASRYLSAYSLGGSNGMQLRRINDPQGDTGPALIMTFEEGGWAKDAASFIKSEGFSNVWHMPEYGLHIYYNIPSLVNKVPLSAAGNPWKLRENAESIYDYSKGACPQSDDLFERSVLVSIPSRLTLKQENAMSDVIRKAVGA